MKQKSILQFILVSLIFFGGGYAVGRFVTKENLFKEFDCFDITNFHADYLVKKYAVSPNTDPSNPRREINQNYVDLNTLIKKTCETDPTNI